MNLKKVDYSIVLAAGRGTRFHSSLPKVLHKISGKTLLENSIAAVGAYTEKEVLVVAGHGLEQVRLEVERIAEKSNFKIRIVHQSEQLGTGHATQVAINEIAGDDGSVLIIPGDCPLIEARAFEKFVEDSFSSELTVLTLQVEDNFGFGRVVRDELGYLTKIVEQKDADEKTQKIKEINSSVYLGKVSLFKSLLPKLSNKNQQSEYYLTDVVGLSVKNDIKVKAFKSEEVLYFLGANSRRELYNLQEKKRFRDLNQLMDRGVTLESIATTFIDDGVEIGTDVYIGSNSRILGNTKIGNGVVIEGDCLIKDSQIFEDVHLKLGVYIDQAIVEQGSALGPFVQIRPNSHLKANVKIGNFVEVKNSTLEEGVKANHLAYLGDIEIGSNSNIGAGTIICNYDGKKKNRSTVGKDSFIGSNSTIISPVKIGDKAYVAAGSVVNKDVQDRALAVGRGRQVNKEGWVKDK